MTNTRFVYSVVRYVPDPGRGEFVNIGAIAGSEDLDQWDIRLTNHWTRVKSLHRTASRAMIHDYLRPVFMMMEADERAADGSGLSEGVLEMMSQDPRSAVQVTAPCPLLAEDVDSALDMVFSQLVSDEARDCLRGVGRRTVRKQLRAAFVAASLTRDRDFRENVQVVAPQGFEGGMDLAITSSEVKGFVQTWSFDVQDREGLRDEIRSWGYLVEKVRSGHSVARVGASEIRVAANVPVDAVYVPPRDAGDATYVDAVRVFDDLGVEHRPVQRASEVAKHARALLQLA